MPLLTKTFSSAQDVCLSLFLRETLFGCIFRPRHTSHSRFVLTTAATLDVAHRPPSLFYYTD